MPDAHGDLLYHEAVELGIYPPNGGDPNTNAALGLFTDSPTGPGQAPHFGAGHPEAIVIPPHA